MEFCEKFPNFKEVIVTNRHLNLHKEILRHRWTEEQWQRNSSAYQNDWDRDWKAAEKLFQERGIRIQWSSEQPETAMDKKRYITTFHTCLVEESGNILVRTSSTPGRWGGRVSWRNDQNVEKQKRLPIEIVGIAVKEHENTIHFLSAMIFRYITSSMTSKKGADIEKTVTSLFSLDNSIRSCLCQPPR